MNRNLVNLIILLISCALVGLVAIQVVWIKQGIEVRAQRFDQSVYGALNRVCNEIELQDAYNYLHQPGTGGIEDIFERMFVDVKRDIQPGCDNHLSDHRGQVIVDVDYDSRNGFKKRVKGRIEMTDTVDSNLRTVVTFDTSIHSPFTETGTNVNVDRIQSQFKKYNYLFQNMAFQMVFNERTITERLKPLHLEQLLEKEFERDGILTDFQFAVVGDEHPSSVVLTNQQEISRNFASNAYKASLFPGDLFGEKGLLMVNFPNRTNYILSTMWLMLTASGLFILIILICFVVSIRIIFHQKKLSDLKSDFINNMTHEFKTPVATISLATEMLQKSQIAEDELKVRNYSSIIQDENKRLSAHIEKVLQAAKLEQDKIELNRVPVHLNDLVEKAATKTRLRTNQTQGEIQCDLDDSIATIEADQVHLANMLHNLLDNAIKYRADRLSIKISTKRHAKQIELSVEDNGIGMSKETQKKIFDRFYRVPTGNVHNVKGFGLGLAYVKAMAEAHGGTVAVSSELDKGSRFFIFLPINQAQ